VRIAVVIPALDEVEWIEAAVASARGDPDVDVLVVDGGSRDRTADRARAAGARVVSSSPGRSRQLEAGWRASDGEAVLFLHADTRLPAGYAGAVRRALEDPEIVGGAFGFRFDDCGSGPSGLGLRIVEWGARLRSRCFRLPYGDQALFARRDVLQDLGGIPQVPIMEDLDLARFLRRRGRLAQLAAPVVTSARRYRRRGIFRTWRRNAGALLAWRLGLDRDRVAAWYRR
jgi:rSAM/selenodomain-associated transferase 2